MGTKRNKILRRICTRKRHKKRNSSGVKKTKDHNSATSYTHLSAVSPTKIHSRSNREPDYGDHVVSEPYHIETQEDISCEPIQGRRVVNLAYFIQQLQNISSHSSLFSCSFKDMTLTGETRNGLTSKYKFKCNMCGAEFEITNEDFIETHNVNVNIAAVTGIISSGIGYSQFQEITACMNIPIFTENTYRKLQDTVYEKWETTALESMEKAAIRERDAAIAEGNFSKDNIPMIDVYADGVWSSRSYGNNYKALSGAAAIVGRKFGEVLFIGIKNKYCLVCARAEKNQLSKPDHVCFKNYTGSSSSMEAEIICQGFEASIDMYNLVYGRLIADGDSATYAKILARNPYSNHTVQKMECRNHLLRNMCNKLRGLTKEIKYPLSYRKTLTDVKIMTIRKVVVTAIAKYKIEKGNSESVENFRKDVLNSIYHAYGNHEQCKNYYCTKEKTKMCSNDLENTTFWFRIKTVIQSLTSKSRSLLEDVDTNIVECFNSVVAKIVGGNRINFSLRRGYRARCSAAVLTFNDPHPRHTLHKKMLGQSPKGILKKIEQQRLHKRISNKTKPHKKNRNTQINKIIQNDYGTQSTTPDLPPDELNNAKEQFLTNLKILTTDKEKIQQSTMNQRDSSDWFELRKNMLTASNFGIVVKRRNNSSKANLVKNILYRSNICNITAVAHGVENEQLALQQLAKQENLKIEPCGLFVDQEYPFIGATPDGLIGEDLIVELKCPIVAYKNGLENSIRANKIQIWKHDKKSGFTSLNKNSNWYYQIQGQLHVTHRQKCLFAVWSGENVPLKIELIERDDVFWESKMKEKLVSFYLDWLLPEIVDSRQARGMELRENDSRILQLSSVANRKRKLNENLSCEKRQIIASTEASISHTLCFNTNENKENMPGCSRQLTFDEL